RSRTVQRMPAPASSPAAIRPTGPAPTTMTSLLGERIRSPPRTWLTAASTSVPGAPGPGSAARMDLPSYNRPVLVGGRVIRKVPAVTLFFWVAKILTTAQGEATSDYLVHTISPYLAVGLGTLGIAVALVWQLSLRRYVAPVYWLAVT